jgi:hypothetical protein
MGASRFILSRSTGAFGRPARMLSPHAFGDGAITRTDQDDSESYSGLLALTETWTWRVCGFGLVYGRQAQGSEVPIAEELAIFLFQMIYLILESRLAWSDAAIAPASQP